MVVDAARSPDNVGVTIVKGGRNFPDRQREPFKLLILALVGPAGAFEPKVTV